ncbi:MAG: hypothetical protein E3K32_13555 [wastewater metagenome]|nr:hypothetical protein [Candidatus Loosdrechtia aerotolerans]
MKLNKKGSTQKGLFISILCLVLLSIGCASTQPVPDPSQISQIPAQEVSLPPLSSSTLTSKIPPGIAGPSFSFMTEDYSIGPKDVLDIKIYGEEDLSRKVRVGADGYINLPLIGWVSATGLNASELESRIAARYSERYLQSPQVSVFVEEFHSKRVAVVGEVKNPQVLKLPRDKGTLLEVISMCGGLGKEAGDIIYVVRPANGDNREEVISVKTAELVKYRNPAANKEILPGDMISIPPATMYFIVGEVSKPGAYMLEQNMTVMQAISQGGKFTDTAKRKVRIMREDPEHGTQVFVTVNMKKVTKGKEEDVEIQGGDVLVVGESTVRRATKETLDFTKAALNAFAYGFAVTAARD